MTRRNSIVAKMKKRTKMVFHCCLVPPTEMRNSHAKVVDSRDSDTKATTKGRGYNKHTMLTQHTKESVLHPNQISEIESEETCLTRPTPNNNNSKSSILCPSPISKIYRRNIFWTKPTKYNVNGSSVPHPSSVSECHDSTQCFRPTKEEVDNISVPQQTPTSEIETEGTKWTRPTDDVKGSDLPSNFFSKLCKRRTLWTKISNRNANRSVQHPSNTSEINEVTPRAWPTNGEANGSTSQANHNGGFVSPVMEVDTDVALLTENDFSDADFIVCNIEDDGTIYCKRAQSQGQGLGLGRRQDSHFFDGEASFSYMVSRRPDSRAASSRASNTKDYTSFAFNV